MYQVSLTKGKKKSTIIYIYINTQINMKRT